MDEQAKARMKMLMGIFKPYATKSYERILPDKKRMVHYTSAENLMRIIQTRTIWLRNTTCMADFREVEHGYDFMLRFFHEQSKSARFKAALDMCFPNVAQETLQFFDDWWKSIKFNTYITSISEHETAEDTHGRLSMWRAFGRGTARAAMVMNVPELGNAEGLHVLLTPVGYFEYEEVEGEIEAIIANISNNVSMLQTTMKREEFKQTMMFVLASLAVSIKHPGFLEEKEWRVVYFPQANPSPLINSSIEAIDGVPQTVYKIPLMDDPENEVIGAGLPSLIDRIIIGPTAYPMAMYNAFVELLRQAGVPKPEERVVFSGIPIRS